MATMRIPVRILITGMNAEINSTVTAGVNEDKTMSARGFIVSNNPESDAELIDVIKQQEYDVIILGKGLRIHDGWFERIESIVKRNSNVSVVEVQGRTADAVKEALHVNGIIMG
jgi:hypothetical protein